MNGMRKIIIKKSTNSGTYSPPSKKCVCVFFTLMMAGCSQRSSKQTGVQVFQTTSIISCATPLRSTSRRGTLYFVLISALKEQRHLKHLLVCDSYYLPVLFTWYSLLYENVFFFGTSYVLVRKWVHTSTTTNEILDV